ncbi:MAG TPA: bifunctional riboflavin kinase/FAD synthetase [Alphaproteobacteria bacterium]|nr:bifunctional riboflavin kinase/FAD synthetase [Alphaproteobacteria bacterium]
MRLFRHCTNLPDSARGAAVAIGNFDGLHRGHQAVIGEAIARARGQGGPSALLTFEPHPRRFFKPDTPPFLLTRLRTKARVVAELGVDLFFVLRFDADLARLSAETFIDRVLIHGLDARHAVVGYDFVFGRNRHGSPELLRQNMRSAGRDATIMPPVTAPAAIKDPDADPEGDIVSSTGVRDALRAGDPAAAAHLLGRPFEIETRVIRGERRGRTLNYPTANQPLGDYIHPAFGVYAVRAGFDAAGAMRWHDGVANLGVRPMYGAAEPLLETHLFDFSGDLYGRILRVQLASYIRPEARFDSAAALIAQMDADSHAARAALSRRAAKPIVRPWLESSQT